MEKSTWEKMAPWFLSICSIAAIVLLSYFIIENINWLKQNTFTSTKTMDSNYYLSIMLIFSSLNKRIIGLFTALCLVFIGMGISAYAMSKQTKIEMKDTKWSLSLITASPGIIAMILGVVLMIYDIDSKDTFNFGNTNQSQYSATQTTGLDGTQELK